MLKSDNARMLIEDERCYQEALAAANECAPGLSSRIERYTGKRPLFLLYDVATQAEKALMRRVWLKSGGFLVIDHAEAMTVIDVNTGKFVGSSGLEDTVARLNLEAVGEIVNQLRLRDVGGIIVIDFIDMVSQENRERVVAALKEALSHDRAKNNVVGFTGLGMLEMTRKKVFHSLRGQLTRPCRECRGEGWEYTPDVIARRALMAVRDRDCDFEEKPLLIRASGEVVRALGDIGVSRNAPVYVMEANNVRGYDISQIQDDAPKGARRLKPYREDVR